MCSPSCTSAVFRRCNVSDGCVGCGASLPYWWPILHHEMWGDRAAIIRKERRCNVSKKRLRAVLASVGQPISVGCCGQECYMKMYGSAITGDPKDIYNHWCKHCTNLIHPALLLEAIPSGDAASPYYCSLACKNVEEQFYANHAIIGLLNGWDSDSDLD